MSAGDGPMKRVDLEADGTYATDEVVHGPKGETSCPPGHLGGDLREMRSSGKTKSSCVQEASRVEDEGGCEGVAMQMGPEGAVAHRGKRKAPRVAAFHRKTPAIALGAQQ